jgi:hypothetical protein
VTTEPALPVLVTDRLAAMEPHHGARSATPAGHCATRHRREGHGLHEGLEGARLHWSSPGGAVTGETISPPGSVQG